MHRTKPFPAEIACALPIRFTSKAPKKITKNAGHGTGEGEKHKQFKIFISDVGVEVKSEASNANDILRGLFQCKKYEALIEAENCVNGIRKEIKVILALEKEFPNELLPIKNILSVNVITAPNKRD